MIEITIRPIEPFIKLIYFITRKKYGCPAINNASKQAKKKLNLSFFILSID